MQRFGEQLDVQRGEAAARVRPVIDAEIADRKVDHLARAGGRVARIAARPGIAADQRGQVGAVDAEHDVGFAADRVGRRLVTAVQILRMGGRDADDVGAVLVGRAQQLDQPDQRRSRLRAAAEPAAEDQRHRRPGQQLRRRGDLGLGGGDRRRRAVARQADIGERRSLAEPRLLKPRIDGNIGRAMRRAFGDAARPQHRFEQRFQRHRFIGPLGVGPHRFALGVGRMKPVDGAAVGRVGRTRPTQHQDRHLVRPGVVERHHRVLQPDQVVEDDQARLAGDLAVALRHVERDLLGAAQDDLGTGVLGVVHQRIVQPAKARPGGEHDVLEPHRLEQIAYPVGAVFGLRPVVRQIDRNLGSETICALVHCRLLSRDGASLAGRPRAAKRAAHPI